MTEIERTLRECEDALLVNELRARLVDAAEGDALEDREGGRLSKLGIVLLNLGADAARLMAEREVQSAIQTADEEPERQPRYELVCDGVVVGRYDTDKEAHEAQQATRADSYVIDTWEHDEPDHDDDPYDDGTIGYDYHGPNWAVIEARADEAAMAEDAHLEAQYEDRVSGDYEID